MASIFSAKTLTNTTVAGRWYGRIRRDGYPAHIRHSQVLSALERLRRPQPRHRIFRLRLHREPGRWRDRGGGPGGIRGGAAHPGGWVANSRGGESPDRAGVRSHARERFGARDPRRQSHLLAQAAGGGNSARNAAFAGRRCFICPVSKTKAISASRRWIRCRWPGLCALPDDPAGFDISPDGAQPAVSSGAAAPLLSWISPTGAAFPPRRTTGEIGLVRFQPFHGADRAQSDSRQLDRGQRQPAHVVDL